MLLERNQQNAPEEVILVGIRTFPMDRFEVEEHLVELGRLVDTAGGEVLFSTVQERHKPDPANYIGKGKLAALKEMVLDMGAKTVVIDATLSPAQHRNLQTELECKVVDRESIIMDIFAQRALTREGKIQVQLAQYEYLLPRLTRMWTHLSRTGGGIGTRGPGETQLETDRRIIQKRIAKLRKEIKKIIRHRELHRRSRQQQGIPIVALVGYTNAGKSTLLNRLCGADALAEDKLFATLDPVVRRTVVEDLPCLVTDTVGLIRRLPHNLVAAFRSTLEEVKEADLILHVIDASHPYHTDQIHVAEEVMEDLGVQETPALRVFNKIDQLEIPPGDFKPHRDIAISAAENLNIDGLRALVASTLREVCSERQLRSVAS